MADDFKTGAEVEVRVSDSSLRAARRTIEQELGDATVGVSAEVATGGRSQQPRDPASGQFMEIKGVEQRLVELTVFAEERNEMLGSMMEDIEEGFDSLAGGGEGGGTSLGGLARGLGSGVGGGLGLTALGIGGGVGLGALGLGAGVGLASGNVQLPEEFSIDPQVEIGEISPVVDLDESKIDFPDVNLASPQFDLNPEFHPTFEPTFNPEFSPIFKPEFSPQLDITTDLRANINISPSFTFSPTLNLTGVDLGGLADDVENAILNSRQFTNEVESISGDIVDDLVKAINRQTGLNLNV